MPHTLINGMPRSGKSIYAQAYARIISARLGVRIVVFNPYRALGWPAKSIDFQDPEEIIPYLDAHRQPTHLYVEECGNEIGRDDSYKVLTLGAHHWGVWSYLVTQYPQSIDPKLRNGCECLVTFATTPRAAEIMAEEFNDEKLLASAKLPPYTYLLKKPFEPVKIGRVDLKKQRFYEKVL